MNQADSAELANSAPEFSIVIPVYNEAENIGKLLRGIEASVTGRYEIIVVYDFDEDTTLPAIKSLDPAIPHLRLVKNELGKGVVCALKAGFQASEAWLGVVVTMGDLSDPPERINSLVEKMRHGYDCVAGSRYMPGGKMVGGPWLKGKLSWLAGASARWLTGIGIHDITTNFRAYSKRLLHEIEIQSAGGFELGLELTVKCHLHGWQVGQVPSEWYDRTAGESRFQLLRWLPGYLRWYLKLLINDPLGLSPKLKRKRKLKPTPGDFGFYYVLERPNYGWVVYRPSPGVVIVPRTAQGKTVLIRIHRPYHRKGESSWELPGGGHEDGEHTVQTAKRELAEETGYICEGEARDLAIDFQPIPGMAHSIHRIVVLNDCRQDGQPTHATDEDIVEIDTFDQEQIKQMVAKGEITALPTLAALWLSAFNSMQ